MDWPQGSLVAGVEALVLRAVGILLAACEALIERRSGDGHGNGRVAERRRALHVGGPCLQRRDVSLRHCLIGRSHERRGRHRRTYAREALLPRDFRAYPGALSHSRIVIGWHRSVQHCIGVRLRIIMSAAEKWEN